MRNDIKARKKEMRGMKECICCGKSYAHHGKYCTAACGRREAGITMKKIICSECRTVFFRTVNGIRVTCSPECAGARKDRIRAERDGYAGGSLEGCDRGSRAGFLKYYLNRPYMFWETYKDEPTKEIILKTFRGL